MKKILPKFKMSSIDIVVYVRNLHHLLENDASYFATRGVTAEDIQAFGDLYIEIEEIPQDSNCISRVSITVEDKDIVRSAVLKTASFIRDYFIVAFGKDSEEYKRLLPKKFADVSDNFLVTLLYDEVRIAEEYISELSAVGLAQADIDKLKTETDGLALELDKVADAKAERRAMTIYRTEKYNEAYSYVVKYTTIGKILAAEYSKVRYKSYLIYPNRSKGRKKVDSWTPDEVS